MAARGMGAAERQRPTSAGTPSGLASSLASTSQAVTSLAQQRAMPVIGFLRSSTLADATNLMAAFRQGVKETGYVEGQNVTSEYRFAEK